MIKALAQYCGVINLKNMQYQQSIEKLATFDTDTFTQIRSMFWYVVDTSGFKMFEKPLSTMFYQRFWLFHLSDNITGSN